MKHKEKRKMGRRRTVLLMVGVLAAVSLAAVSYTHLDFKVFGWYRIVLGVLVLGYFIGKNVIG